MVDRGFARINPPDPLVKSLSRPPRRIGRELPQLRLCENLKNNSRKAAKTQRVRRGGG